MREREGSPSLIARRVWSVLVRLVAWIYDSTVRVGPSGSVTCAVHPLA